MVRGVIMLQMEVMRGIKQSASNWQVNPVTHYPGRLVIIARDVTTSFYIVVRMATILLMDEHENEA